ncbi:MAG: hypothetical protein SAL07_10670 [Oscillatoria sp. PMC 1051.18]|nr:hypothetical protein [Oscillatoria sp. PMC 1050.18]MEC5030367.1 hypothetical protein [Oscillatoria sp. PMC 1051.18]
MHAYKSIALLSLLSIGLTFNPSVTEAYSIGNRLSSPFLGENNQESDKNPIRPKCPGTPGCDRRTYIEAKTESETINLVLKTETQERASGRDKLPVSGSFSQPKTKERASGRAKLPNSGNQARANGRREINNRTENNEKCERASGRYRQNLSVDNCPFNRLSNSSPL